MAEDGLIVNFAASADQLAPRPLFKGGRWRDRLKAVKQWKYKKSKTEPIEDAPQETAHSIPSRPTARVTDERLPKRQKTSHTHERISVTTDGVNRGVVSSLFTHNPESQRQSTGSELQDNAPAKPSNAALAEGAETFATLGLMPSIANHLRTKMKLERPTAIQKAAVNRMLSDRDSDAFIQAETGSGKTLAYLLPMIQQIAHLSQGPNTAQSDPESQLHRDSGLFAIILAPTRELCKQISVILESLLGCARWIVSGNVMGGEKKKSEKARLRKGLNILVATPGRLADHIQHTKVLDVSQVRWLVLDEGDRLMELGYEEDIKTVLKTLDKRSKEVLSSGRFEALPKKRVNILCSATMRADVQRLGELSLKEAVHIQADFAQEPRNSHANGGTVENSALDASEKNKVGDSENLTFSTPAQLQQSYIVVPPKQRLVVLAALLRRAFVRREAAPKAIVFFSCADSVDFHFQIFGRDGVTNLSSKDGSINKLTESHSERQAPKHFLSTTTIVTAPLLDVATPYSTSNDLTSPTRPPPPTIFKLHGSLPQQIRTTTLSAFSRHHSGPGILLCTDVASRGLDLPELTLVVEYDPAFSAADHLHRVGRTARAGREGRATVFLMPGPEEGYVDGVLGRQFRASGEGEGARNLRRQDADDVLRRGFSAAPAASGKKNHKSKATQNAGLAAKGGKYDGPVGSGGSGGGSWRDEATNWQLDAERWVLSAGGGGGGRGPATSPAELARKAYISHVRAYATHVVEERKFFDVKELHLGHLAKAFALRERPGGFGRDGAGAGAGANGSRSGNRTGRKTDARLEKRGEKDIKKDAGDGERTSPKTTRAHGTKRRAGSVDGIGGGGGGGGSSGDVDAAARKMRAAMSKQANAADEFNIG